MRKIINTRVFMAIATTIAIVFISENCYSQQTREVVTIDVKAKKNEIIKADVIECKTSEYPGFIAKNDNEIAYQYFKTYPSYKIVYAHSVTAVCLPKICEYTRSPFGHYSSGTVIKLFPGNSTLAQTSSKRETIEKLQEFVSNGTCALTKGLSGNL